VPWPWFRGRVVIGGDAAHTSPPHLTQGAGRAAREASVEQAVASEPYKWYPQRAGRADLVVERALWAVDEAPEPSS